MPEHTMASNIADATHDRVEQAKSGLANVTSRVQERASELSESASDALHAGRKGAARALGQTAKTLHANAEKLPGGERVTNLAHEAADKIEATARYVRRHSARDMLVDVGELVKEHPGKSLLAAAIVGYLAGRTFRKD